MRHGRMMFNEQDRVQGVCDSPLTELGKQQAACTRDRFFADRNIHLDLAVCSTQEWASDTLECVTDLPYERLKGIKEMSFGIYEGWLNKMIPCDWKTSLPVYGGDLFSVVAERMKGTLTEVMERDGFQSVLAVSHGCAIAAFLEAVGQSPRVFGNCSVAVFDWDAQSGSFELVEIWENPLA